MLGATRGIGRAGPRYAVEGGGRRRRGRRRPAAEVDVREARERSRPRWRAAVERHGGSTRWSPTPASTRTSSARGPHRGGLGRDRRRQPARHLLRDPGGRPPDAGARRGRQHRRRLLGDRRAGAPSGACPTSPPRAALDAATRTLAVDWAEAGSASTASLPDYVETDLTAGVRDHEALSAGLLSRRSRWPASAAPRRSPAWSPSSSPTSPATSPARPSPSTAASPPDPVFPPRSIFLHNINRLFVAHRAASDEGASAITPRHSGGRAKGFVGCDRPGGERARA